MQLEKEAGFQSGTTRYFNVERKLRPGPLAPHSGYSACIKAIFHEIFNKVCFGRFQFMTSHVPVVVVVAEEQVLGLHAQPLQDRSRK